MKRLMLPPSLPSGSEYACFNPYIMKVLCYSLDPSPVSPNNLGFKVAPSSVFWEESVCRAVDPEPGIFFGSGSVNSKRSDPV